MTLPTLDRPALVHCRFEAIHPFADGNGRTGRALALWELYRRGFDSHHIFAVDEFSASASRAPLVLRPKQEQLLQLLRAHGELSPREIWDGLRISKQGAMDLIRPLLKARLIKRVGTLKHGRYVLK